MEWGWMWPGPCTSSPLNLPVAEFTRGRVSCWINGWINGNMNDTGIWVWVNTYRYIFSGMNIHKSQLFWGSLGTRVLTHPHINILVYQNIIIYCYINYWYLLMMLIYLIYQYDIRSEYVNDTGKSDISTDSLRHGEMSAILNRDLSHYMGHFHSNVSNCWIVVTLPEGTTWWFHVFTL